jgi:SNF2 family DNA or RNA helicase
VLKEARALYQAGAVQHVEWKAPLLSAEVGMGNARFFPKLNLKSLTFAENRCNCPEGRRGQICAHAVAACIAIERQEDTPPPSPPPIEAEERVEEVTEQAIRSIRTSDGGTTLVLRFLLPPNLSTAAPRDAIMTKIEVAAGRELTTPEKLSPTISYALSDAHQKAYALLENWCGGKPGSLNQLRRDQLLALVNALRGEPVFAWLKQPDAPIAWSDEKLIGVEEHLDVIDKSSGSIQPAATLTPLSKPTEKDKRPAPSIAVPRRGTARKAPLKRPSAVTAMKSRIAREGRPGSRIQVDGSTRFLAIQLPDRENLLYEPGRKILKENGFRVEPSNGKWWLRDRHKTLNFLAEHEAILRDELDAFFTDNFREKTRSIKRITPKTKIAKSGSDFRINVSLDVPEIEPNEVFRALASRCHYIVKDPFVYLFSPAQLEQLNRAQQALSGEKSRVLTPRFETKLKSSQLRDAEQILEDLDEDIALPEDWKKRSAALARLDKLKEPPISEKLDTTLRTYQKIGTAWLWHLYENKLGGILADEMGLGKTIQALGLLTCAKRALSRPSLVVCPASLLANWEREANTFAPELTVFRHHREGRIKEVEEASNYDIIVTSYATLSRDEDLFAQVDWNIVLADEAQHIKNRRTRAAKALRRQQAEAQFVLTGTPVENSLDDLRSIFAFILPGYLAAMPPGTTGEDRRWYDQRHRAQAAPYILRRTKQLVAPELPEKIQQTIYCDLTTKQRALYQKTQIKTERAVAELELAGKSEAQVRIAALAQLLRLRQVCAEPRLLDDTLSPTDSAKLEAFAEILDEAVDGGHRILVFSQFVKVLNYLRQFLEGLGLPYCYLDGKTRDRLGECDRFNGDDSIPVFLISLKAGGTGLNLTGADTVVHFDPWWNPAAEDQATDRAHRIGQKRTVTSYKLITTNTVEEKVLTLQAEKSALLRDLLDESAAATAKVGIADLKDLLKG